MEFDYTDEQRLFAESVKRFASEYLASGALKRAHNSHPVLGGSVANV